VVGAKSTNPYHITWNVCDIGSLSIPDNVRQFSRLAFLASIRASFGLKIILITRLQPEIQILMVLALTSGKQFIYELEHVVTYHLVDSV